MKYILCLAAFVFLAGTLCAQDLRVSVDRKALAMNEYLQFEVSLINTNGRISMPTFVNFRIVRGPTKGYERQTSNGSVIEVHTQTYVLQPLKPGKHTLPLVKAAVAGGTVLRSNQVQIEVVQNSQDADRINTAENFVAQIKTEKSTVYEGEGLWASYQVFSAYQNVRNWDIKYQDIEGFYAEECEPDINLVRKNIGGRTLLTAESKRMLLYPQRSGDIRLEPFTINAQNVSSRGFLNRQLTPISATSGARVVHVKPLPSPKPGDFVGTYKEYDVKVKVNNRQVPANESITFTAEISGKGNLRLAAPPEFEWPADFERYDPQIKDHININRYVESGKLVYEYLLIPRAPGTFVIPSASQSWFDPASGQYKSVRTSAIEIEVSAPIGGSVPSFVDGQKLSRGEVTTLNQDIRHIKTTPTGLALTGAFFGSPLFWLASLVPFIGFGVFAKLRRNQTEARNDAVGTRQKKAARIARQYLKQAEALTGGDKAAFFDVLNQSLLGYLSDKFRIPKSEFNEDNLREILSGRLPTDRVAEILDLVARCQEARYSPVSTLTPQDAMHQTTTLITQMEQA